MDCLGRSSGVAAPVCDAHGDEVFTAAPGDEEAAGLVVFVGVVGTASSAWSSADELGGAE